jgi:regulator of protease activity HflC (stomatin/prohibitin superfamily)
MIWFFIMVILLGAAFLSWKVEFPGRAIGGGLAIFCLFLASGYTLIRSVEQIPAGHVGIVYQFGDIVDQRGDGLQWIAPWERMRTESVQVQKATFADLNTFSAETQDVFITTTVNYSISPDAVQELFNDVGPDWFDRLVEPRVQNFFKEETVKYSTVDIAPNREVLRRAVRDRLAEDLEKYSITVQDLLIDNLDFRPEFKNAIESKQIATQDALREEERIRQSEAEAQQGVAVASGRAQETIITATAEAEANRLISASLDANVLSIRAIEAFGDDIDIALIPSGEGLILDPATLLRGTAPTEGE